jgi:hypothetical protein
MTIAEHFISSEQSVRFHLLKRLNKFSDHIDGTRNWLKIDCRPTVAINDYSSDACPSLPALVSLVRSVIGIR